MFAIVLKIDSHAIFIGIAGEIRTHDFRDLQSLAFDHSATAILVGIVRFELTTSWSQTRRTARLCYTPSTFLLTHMPNNVPQ